LIASRYFLYGERSYPALPIRVKNEQDRYDYEPEKKVRIR
jgi:hypothetical protein